MPLSTQNLLFLESDNFLQSPFSPNYLVQFTLHFHGTLLSAIFHSFPDKCSMRSIIVNRIQRVKRNSTKAFVKAGLFAKGHQVLGLTYPEEQLNYVVLEYPSQGMVKTSSRSILVGPVSLLSNIGGGIGLALGISIHSIIDYLIKIILDTYT